MSDEFDKEFEGYRTAVLVLNKHLGDKADLTGLRLLRDLIDRSGSMTKAAISEASGRLTKVVDDIFAKTRM